MNKPSTWLALIAAAVYIGAYWYSNKDFDAMYGSCVKEQPAREQFCACRRDEMSGEVSLYRIITGYTKELERVKKFGTIACARK
ncbi:MAG: hypothetical protein VYA59_01530 [Pseudomonadota bacterium]|jgi:hypothetical protein|nr:hypothetical protein [Pseudomonadota bacterium]